MVYIRLDDKGKVKESDYNWIVSSSILSIVGEFTIDDIIHKVEKLTKESSPKWERTIEKSLERLREDGFISSLGSYYTVDNWGM